MKNVKYYAELNIDTLLNYIVRPERGENLINNIRAAEEVAIKEILEDGEYYIKEATGGLKRSINHNKDFDFDDFDYKDIALIKKYSFRELAFHFITNP